MEIVGNQDILERGQEGLELKLSTQEAASEERRRMGEGLERRGSEMKGWNINWCSGGVGREPWTLWREMGGTLILAEPRGREEGINSLRGVETLNE